MPFHQQHIEVRRRHTQQLLEYGRLPAVGPQVSGVEEPPPVGFDEQGVRVEGAVVVQKRSDAEGAKFERLSMPQVAGRLSVDTNGAEERCLAENA